MAKSILASFGSVEEKRRELNRSDVELIFYKDIKPADKNRKIRNAEELAEDILEDGLEHNILVRELENNNSYKYEIIAGHRRYTAICILIKNGHTDFEYIPCKIKKNMDDLEARKRLHLNNINQSGYTPAEMLDAIEELQEIYKIKKKQDGIPGRIQKLISEDIGLQKTQIGNYQFIIKNATPEVRELIRTKDIPISTALALCTLDNENQLMFIETEDNIDLITIREYKEMMNSNKDEKLSKSNDQENESYYDQFEDDFEEEFDDSDEEIEESIINTTIEDYCFDDKKDLTLSGMSKYAREYIENMIATMEKHTEWKREKSILEDILNQFNSLLDESGLNN